jgi:hypothetical protein
MALTHRGDRIAAPAGEDLTGKEYHAGGLHATEDSIILATTPALCFGVIVEGRKAGEEATLQHSNVSPICVGADVTNRGLVAPNGSGRFVNATSGQRSIVRVIHKTGTLVDGALATALIGRVETA